MFLLEKVNFSRVVTFQRVRMSQGSSRLDDLDDLWEWVSYRAFHDTRFSTEYRHLTPQEKFQIDMTIGRTLETHRRIETKLLHMGMNGDPVLDPLRW
jgi:dTDP-D-glucose 4,6-dehydratase